MPPLGYGSIATTSSLPSSDTCTSPSVLARCTISESISTGVDPLPSQIFTALPQERPRQLQVEVYTMLPSTATSAVVRSETTALPSTASCSGGPGSIGGSVGSSLHAAVASSAIISKERKLVVKCNPISVHVVVAVQRRSGPSACASHLRRS